MIPLYKPHIPDNLPELSKILQSGTLSYGPWGRRFEDKLCEFIGNRNIAVVNSFNSALLVTLTTLGIKAGDEVITSPMSCLASNQPLVTMGVNVVWADIDPETGTLNPESVKTRITSKTKAIIHYHHCGYPGYIDEINEVARQYGIFVIDDAIEAFGSEYNGKRIGNTGADATVFSFQTVRLPNTIDGGAFAFKSNILFERAKLVRDLGINRAIFRDEIGNISKECDISEPGYGATLNEANSYIGFLQMEEIDYLLNKQYTNGNAWLHRIENQYKYFKVLTRSFQKPNYWIFGLLANNKNATILHFRDKGYYASGVHFPNNYYSVFGKQSVLSGVEDFYTRFVALPSGWWFSL